LNSLFEDIKRSSQILNLKYSKRDKLSILLKRIERNGSEIEQLLSKDSQERTYYDDKIDEIQSMVEFVVSKPLELEEDAK
jgi:Mg2+ and Co2+ transporter CorA